MIILGIEQGLKYSLFSFKITAFPLQLCMSPKMLRAEAELTGGLEKKAITVEYLKNNLYI